MSKRRVVFGVLKTPAGDVAIKNGAVARALEQNQEQIQHLVERQNGMAQELRERNERLARLQNHWWVRMGEALRLVKP